MNEKEIIKQERAEKLFANTPIKKAIWIVALPSLLAALMLGLYFFIDQIFIQKFVPQTRYVFDDSGKLGEIYSFLDNGVQKLTQSEFLNLFNKYNSFASSKISTINSNTVVSQTMVAIQPFTIFSNSIVFLIPVGSAIYYTKCVSKGYKKAGQNLWASMFWTSIVTSLLATLVTFIFIWSGFLNSLVGITKLDQNVKAKMNANEFDLLQSYYYAAAKMSAHWAKQYMYVYASGTILQGLVNLLSYLIRAEGYNAYVMGWAIGANLVNIALDALFMIPLKMGVLGGVIATLIGWFVNLLAYLAYCAVKEKKDKTWLYLSVLFKFKFTKKMLGPVILLGLSGFIRTFGVAISFTMISFLFSKTPFADPGHFQYYWSKSAPIVSLFLTSIYGINDGARSLLSYNYAKKDYERCKQTYYWTMFVAIFYTTLTYTFIALTANVIWVPILNVIDAERIETVKFIRIMMLRLIAVSLSVSSLLVFQATNNIGKSLLASVMENFICAAIVIPIGYGIAYAIFLKTSSVALANWIIAWFFIINLLIASTILFIMSSYYITKGIKRPKVKQSWSEKIEEDFHKTSQEFENFNKI